MFNSIHLFVLFRITFQVGVVGLCVAVVCHTDLPLGLCLAEQTIVCFQYLFRIIF